MNSHGSSYRKRGESWGKAERWAPGRVAHRSATEQSSSNRKVTAHDHRPSDPRPVGHRRDREHAMTSRERRRLVIERITRRYRHRARLQWQATHREVAA